MVHGDIEKALDGGGVQIHGQKAIHPGGGDQVGHQLGRDRLVPPLFLFLLGIGHVGHHCRNAPG